MHVSLFHYARISLPFDAFRWSRTNDFDHLSRWNNSLFFSTRTLPRKLVVPYKSRNEHKKARKPKFQRRFDSAKLQWPLQLRIVAHFYTLPSNRTERLLSLLISAPVVPIIIFSKLPEVYTIQRESNGISKWLVIAELKIAPAFGNELKVVSRVSLINDSNSQNRRKGALLQYSQSFMFVILER